MRLDALRRRYLGYDEAMNEIWRSKTGEITKEHADVLRQIPSGWTNYQWELSRLLMLLKHPSFYAEREIRAIKEQDDGDLMFRGTERAIVPFTELRFRSGNERGALRAVRVGPGIDFTDVQPVVSRLLFQTHYDGVTIERSNCTFRG